MTFECKLDTDGEWEESDATKADEAARWFVSNMIHEDAIRLQADQDFTVDVRSAEGSWQYSVNIKMTALGGSESPDPEDEPLSNCPYCGSTVNCVSCDEANSQVCCSWCGVTGPSAKTINRARVGWEALCAAIPNKLPNLYEVPSVLRYTYGASIRIDSKIIPAMYLSSVVSPVVEKLQQEICEFVRRSTPDAICQVSFVITSDKPPFESAPRSMNTCGNTQECKP